MTIAAVVLVAGLAAGCEQTGEGGATDTAANLEIAPAVAQETSVAPTEQDVVARAAEKIPTPQPASAPLQIEFDPPVLNFGFVKPGKDVTGTVAIRNVGTGPARILSVKPTCKCTTLNDLTGSVIQPGESLDLEARLEGRTLTGNRSATIKILFDGATQAHNLDLRAEVTNAVRVTPSILNMAPRERGGPFTTSGHVVIEAIDDRPFTVLAVNGEPPRFSQFDPDFDEARHSYLVEWDLADDMEADELPGWWIIETDHPDCPILDAWVRHPNNIRIPPRGRPWSVTDLRAMLGIMKAGEPKDVEITVKDLGEDTIYQVQSLSEAFDAELVSVERRGADAICTVRVTPKPGYRGLLIGPIELFSSESWHQMDVVGKVIS